MDDFGTCIACSEPDVELDQDRLCVSCAKESAQANGMDLDIEEE